MVIGNDSIMTLSCGTALPRIARARLASSSATMIGAAARTAVEKTVPARSATNSGAVADAENGLARRDRREAGGEALIQGQVPTQGQVDASCAK